MTWHRVFCTVCAGAILFAAAGLAGAADGAPGSARPASGSNYLDSRLLPTEPQGSCTSKASPIYRAYEIVTGTDMRQRPWGFAQTFREVLVKASGDPRLKHDPRIERLAAEAARYVACFRYADLMADAPLHDEQGTYDRPHRLTVYFDAAKIDAVLASLGDRPWRGARPIVVPVVLVHGPKPPPYVLSAEDPTGAEQRGSFAVAAGQFGLRYRIPGEADLARWGVSAAHFPPVPPPSSAAEAIVAGTLDWSETLPGWIGKWQMRWHGVDHNWGVSGVNYDAAFRDMIGGVELIASGNGAPGPAAR